MLHELIWQKEKICQTVGLLAETGEVYGGHGIMVGARSRRAPTGHLIRFREIHFSLGRLAADDAGSFFGGLVERDVAGGGFGIFLDLGFTLA